jgi:hypothetical protein
MVRFGRVQTMLVLGIAMIALGTVLVPEAGAQSVVLKPLALTGYNADMITDKEPLVRFAEAFDGGKKDPPATGGCSFFESGGIDDSGTQRDNGLPAGTVFLSQTGSGAVYLIQPAVFKNVLQVPSGGIGTLSLVTPGPYSQIGVIASSGNAGQFTVGDALLTYDDGSSETVSYNNFDWCNNSNHAEAAIPDLGFGPIQRSCPGNLSLPQNQTRFVYNAPCQSFNVFETIITTDPTKNLVSVSFVGPDSANWSNIFGISAAQ